MDFSDSGEVYAWLSSFVNLERGYGGKPGEHFRLDRMRLLAALAENPENSAPVIHIAGSKGKGTVTAMIAAVLEAAGKRSVRYMSPHVSDWRERICRGGAFFSEAIYTGAGRELFETYNKYQKDSGALGEATFFELFTLYFFLCSRRADCDFLVVETGLGGTFDATNIVNPAVTVITVIEKEHTEYLGNDLESIAGEKAGIIKPGKPVVAAEQKTPLIADVFRNAAEKNGAPFYYLPECAAIEENETNREGAAFCLRFFGASGQFEKLSGPYTVPIPGAVQARNATEALAAGALALPGLDAETAKAGLANLAALSLPARFERLQLRLGPSPGSGVPVPVPVIVDGAHTAQSAALCAQTFCSLYGEGGVLLFGCAKEKDAAAMAEILVPRFSFIVITAPGNFRASDPQAVYAAFAEVRCRTHSFRQAQTAGNTAAESPALSLVPDTETAIAGALNHAETARLPLLVCGSFYLAGKVRDVSENRTSNT